MENENQQISLVIEKSNDAKTLPVTGVWGGPAPDGLHIIAHLYIESPAMPNVINVSADEDGRYDPNKGETIARGDFLREIQTTLVLSPEGAMSVGKWLLENGEMLRQARSVFASLKNSM